MHPGVTSLARRGMLSGTEVQITLMHRVGMLRDIDTAKQE